MVAQDRYPLAVSTILISNQYFNRDFPGYAEWFERKFGHPEAKIGRRGRVIVSTAA